MISNGVSPGLAGLIKPRKNTVPVVAKINNQQSFPISNGFERNFPKQMPLLYFAQSKAAAPPDGNGRQEYADGELSTIGTIAVGKHKFEKPILVTDLAGIVMNITPSTEGQTLIVNKAMKGHLRDLSDNELLDICWLLQLYLPLWEGLPENQGKRFDYSSFINDGRWSGQTEPQFHIQVTPVEASLASPHNSDKRFLMI